MDKGRMNDRKEKGRVKGGGRERVRTDEGGPEKKE